MGQHTNAHWNLHETHFLWMTEFPCGAGSSFQSVVTENGKEYMGFHTELAVYGGHDKQMSQKELEALHRAIQDLPPTNAAPSIESLVIVSFREGTNWITRTYDTDELPKPMYEVYRITGVKWQHAARVK